MMPTPPRKSGDPDFCRAEEGVFAEDAARQVAATGSDPTAYRALCDPVIEIILAARRRKRAQCPGRSSPGRSWHLVGDWRTTEE